MKTYTDEALGSAGVTRESESADLSVPLLDLRIQYKSIEQEIHEAMRRVLDSQRFILGTEVEALEREIGRYCGCTYAIGVSSGTDAVLSSLMALGISAGDEVITTPFSFFATVGSILRLGAEAVFVDIDPETFNLDTTLVEKALTRKTKAILPVHLFGQCADMDPLLQIAQEKGIPVVEDAAQAIGAEYGGRRAGSMGTLGCFSFFPSKNLGAFGDGGMVTTNDKDLAEKVAILRNQGSEPKYHHKVLGGNFRLDALQAAVLRVKLRCLDEWSARRRANASFYTAGLDRLGLTDRWVVPPPVRYERHIFNQYVIRARDRDDLRAFLKESRIDTEIYYPKSLHQQQCVLDRSRVRWELPVSEEANRSVLALPVYPELSVEQKEYVLTRIKDFYEPRS